MKIKLSNCIEFEILKFIILNKFIIFIMYNNIVHDNEENKNND